MVLPYILFAILLVGCVHKIELTHFQTGQVLQGEYNTGSYKISITMPNGEILSGKYVALENASFSFGTATAFSGMASATAFGQGIAVGGAGQAYALLKSEKSSLMMEIVASYSEWSGHGFGEARTNDGRTFKVQF